MTESDNIPPETEELQWYWAIFKDHVPKVSSLGCSLMTQWFDTLEEAKSQMRNYDRQYHRIHGVLRSDGD